MQEQVEKMATKFFQDMPKWLAGLILVIGSGFDAAAVISAFEKYPFYTAGFVIAKTMINKFDKLYRGTEDSLPK